MILYCDFVYGRGLFKFGLVGFFFLGLEFKFRDFNMGLFLFVNIFGEICVWGEFIMKGEFILMLCLLFLKVIVNCFVEGNISF